MAEYKGITTRDKRWIYGERLTDGKTCFICPTERLKVRSVKAGDKVYHHIDEAEFFEVIPETVSRNTGIKDVNGKEIYTNDCVSYINDDGDKCIFPVIIKDGAFRYVEEGNEDDNLLSSLLVLDFRYEKNKYDNLVEGVTEYGVD